MTSRDFCFWLQGFFELSDPDALSPTQVDLIKKHLSMVFIHEIDPSMPNPKLDEVHASGPGPTSFVSSSPINTYVQSYPITGGTILKC